MGALVSFIAGLGVGVGIMRLLRYVATIDYRAGEMR